jgi:hypothetical protein
MRRARHKLQVDTFPFLAVLLAAMGSLILLLFIIDRRAKIVSQNKNKERLEAYLQARADKLVKLEAERQAKWQAERDALHEQLALRHDSLAAEKGGLDRDLKKAEDTVAAYRIQQRLLEMELAKAESDLARERSNMHQRRESTLAALSHAEQTKRAELMQLTQELLRMEAMVKNLKLHKSNEPEVYSLIPYKGKRGDQRRPLYVECLAQGLLFHPERSLLQGAQMTVENIREEVEARGLRRAGASRDELYVMFLIRPSGVASYALARQSMAIYKVDFGYELVDADWVFDFAQEDAIARMIAGKETKRAVLPATATPASPKTASVLIGSGRDVAPPPPAHGAGSLGKAGSGLAGRGGLEFTPAPYAPTPPGGAGVGKTPGAAFGATGGVPGTQISTGAGAVPGGLPGRTGEMPGQQPSAPGAFAGNTTFGPIGGAAGTQPLGISATNGQNPGGTGTAAMGSKPTVHSPGTTPSPGTAGMLDANRSVVAQNPASRPPGMGQPPGMEQPPGMRSAPDVTGVVSAPGGQSAPVRPFEETPEQNRPNVDPNLRPKQPGNEAGEPADALSRYTPTVNAVAANNPPSGPRVPPRPLTVGRIVGNREFVITIECDAERATVFPTGSEFDMADAPNAKAIDQDIVRLVQQLVARRQATVQPGEPPYRPRLRLQVKPDGARTYYRVYPLLMNLGIPMGRDNVE